MLAFPMAWGQGARTWVSAYDHYQGAYKCDLLCKWMLSNEQRDSLNTVNRFDRHYCGSFDLTLTERGTYTLYLHCLRNVAGRVMEEAHQFSGSYTVSNAGTVLLKGEHPFKGDELHIRESTRWKNGGRSVKGRGFRYRFNASFRWISNKALYTFCDGCVLDPIDQ
jgi:hypothetical protein